MLFLIRVHFRSTEFIFECFFGCSSFYFRCQINPFARLSVKDALPELIQSGILVTLSYFYVSCWDEVLPAWLIWLSYLNKPSSVQEIYFDVQIQKWDILRFFFSSTHIVLQSLGWPQDRFCYTFANAKVWPKSITNDIHINYLLVLNNKCQIKVSDSVLSLFFEYPLEYFCNNSL